MSMIPETPTPGQTYRQALATIADKARSVVPECGARIDAATKLVLSGFVELHTDGTATVASRPAAAITCAAP